MIKDFTVLIPVEYSHFEATIAFYTETLGIPEDERGESELGNPWCRLSPAGSTITIHTGREGRFPYPEFRPTGHGVALAFQVSDLGHTVKSLESGGFEPLNRWEYPDGGQAVSVLDPAGNVLELWEDAP